MGIRTATATLAVVVATSAHAFQEPSPTPETVRVTAHGVVPADAGAPSAHAAAPVVELAICLDTSGSMSGLIETAKQRLWAIVNDLALAEPTPQLRVALLTFGNDGHEESDGWVRVHTGFTTDLDLVSQELFSLSTNGGTELVGRVMNASLQKLSWTESPQALKLMVVAGNESADQDQVVSFRDASASAIARDIMVSAIYCGGDADAEAPGWKEVALLADGYFAVLDHNAAPLAIETPFDGRLGELSTALNGTYLPYGELGEIACQNQWTQDANAAGLNGAVVAQRAATKAGKLYQTAHWDLVDACKQEGFVLADVKEEDLPEAMRAMTAEERAAHVAAMDAERTRLQAEVTELTRKRDAMVLEARRSAGQGQDDAFDRAIRVALRARAEAKGLRFQEPQAMPVSETAPEAASATTMEVVAPESTVTG